MTGADAEGCACGAAGGFAVGGAAQALGRIAKDAAPRSTTTVVTRCLARMRHRWPERLPHASKYRRVVRLSRRGRPVRRGRGLMEEVHFREDGKRGSRT